MKRKRDTPTSSFWARVSSFFSSPKTDDHTETDTTPSQKAPVAPSVTVQPPTPQVADVGHAEQSKRRKVAQDEGVPVPQDRAPPTPLDHIREVARQGLTKEEFNKYTRILQEALQEDENARPTANSFPRIGGPTTALPRGGSSTANIVRAFKGGPTPARHSGAPIGSYTPQRPPSSVREYRSPLFETTVPAMGSVPSFQTGGKRPARKLPPAARSQERPPRRAPVRRQFEPMQDIDFLPPTTATSITAKKILDTLNEFSSPLVDEVRRGAASRASGNGKTKLKARLTHRLEEDDEKEVPADKIVLEGPPPPTRSLTQRTTPSKRKRISRESDEDEHLGEQATEESVGRNNAQPIPPAVKGPTGLQSKGERRRGLRGSIQVEHENGSTKAEAREYDAEHDGRWNDALVTSKGSKKRRTQYHTDAIDGGSEDEGIGREREKERENKDRKKQQGRGMEQEKGKERDQEDATSREKDAERVVRDKIPITLSGPSAPKEIPHGDSKKRASTFPMEEQTPIESPWGSSALELGGPFAAFPKEPLMTFKSSSPPTTAAPVATPPTELGSPIKPDNSGKELKQAEGDSDNESSDSNNGGESNGDDSESNGPSVAIKDNYLLSVLKPAASGVSAGNIFGTTPAFSFPLKSDTDGKQQGIFRAPLDVDQGISAAKGEGPGKPSTEESSGFRPPSILSFESKSVDTASMKPEALVPAILGLPPSSDTGKQPDSGIAKSLRFPAALPSFGAEGLKKESPDNDQKEVKPEGTKRDEAPPTVTKSPSQSAAPVLGFPIPTTTPTLSLAPAEPSHKPSTAPTEQDTKAGVPDFLKTSSFLLSSVGDNSLSAFASFTQKEKPEEKATAKDTEPKAKDDSKSPDKPVVVVANEDQQKPKPEEKEKPSTDDAKKTEVAPTLRTSSFTIGAWNPSTSFNFTAKPDTTKPELDKGDAKKAATAPPLASATLSLVHDKTPKPAASFAYTFGSGSTTEGDSAMDSGESMVHADSNATTLSSTFSFGGQTPTGSFGFGGGPTESAPFATGFAPVAIAPVRSTTTPAGGMFMFGAADSSSGDNGSAASSVFGAPAAAGMAVFGSSAAPTTTPSPFGVSSTPSPFGGQPTFGSSAPASVFGSSSSSIAEPFAFGGAGAAAPSQFGSASVFGGSGGGGAAAGGMFAFGSQPPPSGGGMFDSQQPSPSPFSGFGSTPQQPSGPGFGSSFGAAQPSSAAGGFSLGVAPAAEKNGAISGRRMVRGARRGKRGG